MQNEKETRSNRILTVVGTVLCIILLPILVINLTLIAKSLINKDEVPSFGGMLPLFVITPSMEPVIFEGDLVICQVYDPADVKERDIISFFDPQGSGTSITTHRVIALVYDENGKLFFQTQGDNNSGPDPMLTPAENLVGIYRMRVPFAGYVAMAMQSPTGLVVCIVSPILLFVGYDFLRRRRYEKGRQQDTEALLKELEALRALKEGALREQSNETQPVEAAPMSASPEESKPEATEPQASESENTSPANT